MEGVSGTRNLDRRMVRGPYVRRAEWHLRWKVRRNSFCPVELLFPNPSAIAHRPHWRARRANSANNFPAECFGNIPGLAGPSPCAPPDISIAPFLEPGG